MFKVIERFSRTMMVLTIFLLAGSTTTYSQTAVTLPTVTGKVGDTVALDVNVGDISGEGVIGFNFSFTYDPAVLSITGFDRTGTTSAGFSNVLDNNDNPGTYTIGGFNISPVEGEGKFVTISAEIVGNGVSPLTWTKAEINKEDDTILGVVTTDGQVNAPARDIDVFFNDITVPLGGDFALPIEIKDLLAGDEILSIEMAITYDAAVLDVTSVEAGPVADGATVVSNIDTDGQINIAIAKATAIEGDGVLLTVNGSAQTSGNANFTIDSVTLNDGDPAANVMNGSITSIETVVTVSDFTGVTGRTVMIPVTSSGYDGTIATFGFTVDYDDTKINVTGVSTEGTLTQGFSVVYNPENNKVSGASATGFSGNGTLLFLEATLLEASESDVTLNDFSYVTFDETEVVTGVLSGTVSIVDNSAPVFAATVADTTVTRGDTYMFTYAATDANGDMLSYATDGTIDGVVIDAETGMLEWAPAVSQIGVNTLTVQVSDGDTTISTTTTVTVNALTARAQIIHNAADTLLGSVDVYANGAVLVPALGFREATPFVDVPAEVEIDVDLYLTGTEPGSGSPAFSAADVVFEPGKTYTIIANGVATDGYAANPDGISTAFELHVFDDAKESHETAEEASIYAWHGVTDAPTVDIYARDIGKLVDAAAYGDRTEYLNVPASSYILDITAAGSSDVLLSYTADLTSAGGQVVGVLASGFLDPSANKDGAAFGLLAVFADGSTALLPTAAAPTVDVTFTVYLDLATNFNPANDDLYLSGSFVGGGGWDQPGSNPTAKLEPVDGNELLYSVTYPIMKGDHAYKYFSVPKGTTSWDNGEWPGDPNRNITVVGYMEVSDLYGVKPGETITINTARGLQSGAPVLVAGVSTTPDFGFNSAQFYMQDAEAGVKVFHRGTGGGNTDTPYAEGQSLIMEGTMGAFNDEIQLAATGYTVVSEGNGLPDPVIFPSYEEWVVDSKYQGMRVTLTNMVLPEASGWPVEKITSGSGVTTQIEGTLEQLLGTYDVRIDRDESFFDESARPTGNFNMTGVMGRFRNDVQLFPFFEDELGEATSNEVENGLPTEFELTQNYPNPFNPSTQITFALPEASDVRLEVYNVMGQRVASLVNGKLNAGYHTVQFDATSLSSGTYFYRIMAGSFMQTRSMMLIK